MNQIMWLLLIALLSAQVVFDVLVIIFLRHVDNFLYQRFGKREDDDN